MEFNGILPIKLITKKRKNKERRINLPTLALTEERSKFRSVDLREEKRLEREK